MPSGVLFIDVKVARWQGVKVVVDLLIKELTQATGTDEMVTCGGRQ